MATTIVRTAYLDPLDTPHDQPDLLRSINDELKPPAIASHPMIYLIRVNICVKEQPTIQLPTNTATFDIIVVVIAVNDQL